MKRLFIVLVIMFTGSLLSAYINQDNFISGEQGSANSLRLAQFTDFGLLTNYAGNSINGKKLFKSNEVKVPKPFNVAKFQRNQKLHKYYGYTTLVLGVVSAISSSNEKLHRVAAYGAGATAIATCYTGFSAYGNVISLRENIFSKDNSHALIGLLGTAGFITAIALAESGEIGSHAGIGVAGGGAWFLSTVIIKW